MITDASRLVPITETPRAFRDWRTRSWGLLLCSVALAAIGVATVSSAASELAINVLPRQIVWVLLGLVVLAIGALLDYQLLMRIAGPLYGVGLLGVLLILFFGHEAGGARSWIGIAGFGGQPTDVAKLATALLIAQYLSTLRERYLGFKELAISGLIVGTPMTMVALQPDLGSALMFTPIFAGAVLVAGVKPRHLVVGGILALVVGTGIWTYGMRDYQRDRVMSFLSPESDPLGAGYQVRQSKIAVGSGALVGKGYRQGTQSQLRFLPARHTDFVFAVLAEEWGFAGVVGVLILYVLYLYAGLRIALSARDRAGLLIGASLLSALTIHVLYNTAMVVGLLPVTGIPLPFLSYGGSFILFCFFSTGVLLGIDLRRYVNA